MKKYIQRGFTLMELLVVIAIIGILASVVLASLNTARSKGADAAVKSNLANARAQAELYYDNNTNSYATVCTAAGGIATMVAGADTANSGGTVDCDSSASAWAAEGQLVSNTAQYFCVDSTGSASVESASKGASATVCP